MSTSVSLIGAPYILKDPDDARSDEEVKPKYGQYFHRTGNDWSYSFMLSPSQRQYSFPKNSERLVEKRRREARKQELIDEQIMQEKRRVRKMKIREKFQKKKDHNIHVEERIGTPFHTSRGVIQKTGRESVLGPPVQDKGYFAAKGEPIWNSRTYTPNKLRRMLNDDEGNKIHLQALERGILEEEAIKIEKMMMQACHREQLRSSMNQRRLDRVILGVKASQKMSSSDKAFLNANHPEFLAQYQRQSPKPDDSIKVPPLPVPELNMTRLKRQDVPDSSATHKSLLSGLSPIAHRDKANRDLPSDIQRVFKNNDVPQYRDRFLRHMNSFSRPLKDADIVKMSPRVNSLIQTIHNISQVQYSPGDSIRPATTGNSRLGSLPYPSRRKEGPYSPRINTCGGQEETQVEKDYNVRHRGRSAPPALILNESLPIEEEDALTSRSQIDEFDKRLKAHRDREAGLAEM